MISIIYCSPFTIYVFYVFYDFYDFCDLTDSEIVKSTNQLIDALRLALCAKRFVLSVV